LALYEGLKQGRFVSPAAEGRPLTRRPLERPRPMQATRSGAFKTLRAQVQGGGTPGASWVDRLFGSGSEKTIGNAGGSLMQRFHSKRAVAAPAKKEARPVTVARMQVVGAGDSEIPHGRRGLGRALFLVLALAGVAAALRPWQKSGMVKADWSALFRLPASENSGGPDKESARVLAQEKSQQAEDSAKLAALPLQAGTGRALGLWQDAGGRWWRVDAQGALAPCTDPSGEDNLGLPELHGVGAHAEAYRGGRRLILDLPPGRLGQLLPLQASVASEVRSVVLDDPAQPVLITLAAVRCLMGDGDWVGRQRHLALVLADLAARRRGASQVDLRFDGTAVVRPR